jgi:hypothetical protein
MGHDQGFPCLEKNLAHDGPCRTPLSEEAAALLRHFGFDTPGRPIKVGDSDITQIEAFLTERMGEYFRTEGDGYRLNVRELARVVADVAVAAVKTDRRRRAARAREGGGPDAA